MSKLSSWTIVILGATGDLTRRKLIPALYALLEHGSLLKFVFVGAAHDAVPLEQIFASASPYVKHKNQALWEKFIEHSYYHQLDFERIADYQLLSDKLADYEALFNLSGNRLFYLAAAAQFYCTITENLAQSGIAWHQSAHHDKIARIVYEKPFGWDLASAREINICIKKYFDEQQIYRVDHYLTKSLVASILLLRFTNTLFEPVWHTHYIDHVQIIFSEKLSIEGRAAFYEQFGALKDVVQNHILQLLSLIAMEPPTDFKPELISACKAELLKQVIVKDGLLGQYNGYRSEPGVNPHSTVETFVVLELAIETERWRGVPFFIKAGKDLADTTTEIHIIFKEVSKQHFGGPGSFDPNILSIRIAPNSGFSLALNVQKAGMLNTVISIPLDFCYTCTFGTRFPKAYEILLKEVLTGDHAIAVSSQEIEYAWQIIDKVKTADFPLYWYEPGTKGPAEADEFIENKKRKWRL
jgi:glucose-6-phosphate 1-dehydrogenase